MNNKEYNERLDQLVDDLDAAGNARPYNPDEYNRIVDELNALIHALPARPKSKWILRIICRAGKRGFAAAGFLKEILKRGMSR